MTKSIDDEIAFRSWLGQRLAGAGWFVLIGSFLLALPVLMDLSPLILLPILVLASLLATAWVLLYRRLSARAATRHPGPQWAKTVLLFTGLLGIVAALPIYLLAIVAETRPVIMPQVVLSNGERTLTFQGMTHIGTEEFYKSVVYDLERAKSEGYTIFFEGVQPSTSEADRWFADTLAGGGDLSANYDALAQTCGLHFQLEYFEFLGDEMRAEPDRYINADVTTAEMMAEAQRLAAEDPEVAEALADRANQDDGEAADALDGFVELQNSGTEGQKELAGIVCRGTLSLVHGGGQARSVGPLDPVVVGFRNRKLVDRILTSQDELIFVTYGAGHLPGVIDLLESAEPPWEVESVKWIRAISPPEEYDADFR